MRRIRKIEVSVKEALLIITTIASLGAMTGALYGAASQQQANSNDLVDCEARNATPCMIVAVPAIQSPHN